jgi:hypothetical protein
MIVYEVDVEVDRAIAEAYRAWLTPHVAEIVAMPGFAGATVFERLDPPAPDGRFALCMHYRVRDRASLDAYLRDHAPRLRQDGIARFGGRFDATRRVLEISAETPEAT